MKYVVPDSTVFGVQNITSHHYHTPPHVCFLIRRRDLYTSIDASMTRENHYLFPDTFYTAPLETWAAAIQRLASEARQCLLEQVVHYKALSDMEHEFLVVYASHPSGSKIVLGIDRNAQDFVSAASKLKRASASQGTDTTQPSTAKTVASSSARYLNTLMSTKSTPLYSSSPFLPPPVVPLRPPPPPLPARTQSVIHLYYTSPSSYSRSTHTSHLTPSSDTNVFSLRA